MSANATNKRIYIKTDGNWIQYCGGHTHLYVWTGEDPNPVKYNGDWPGNELTNKIEGTYGTWGVGLFYVDIDLPDTEVNFIINNGSDGWKTGTISGALDDNSTIFWYSSGGSGNTNVSIIPDALYWVSWIEDNDRTATEVSLNNNSFSVDIDVPSTNTYCCIAPAYALSHDKKNIDLWSHTILPKTNGDNYQINSFIVYTDELQKSNASCWTFTTSLKTKATFFADLNTMRFTITPYFTRTINGAESNGKYYATFSSDYDVAVPTGITAYYGDIKDESKVIMTSFGEGVGIASTDAAFLEVNSASDTYTFTPATSTRSGSNLMKKPAGGVTPEGAYVFANKSAGVGFYKTTTDLNNQQGKAYLGIESSAPSFSIEIEGETTGIKVINLDENIQNDGQMFDLQGRRVAEPTKGVYIVNGKKVIFK